MSGSVNDGASVSLSRQLSMIRFIRRAPKKGVSMLELRMHITVTKGLSDGWLNKYLRKWIEFKVIERKGARFTVNEEMWTLVQKMRDEEATMLEG